MATALASQLQALAAPTHSFSKTRTRPSILFDAQQAADIDIAATFSLALAGLEELASLDSRFLAFQRSLFSAESCQLDRELQEREINANLDATLRSYMCLLSDYLLLSAAQQTLEYLIRRYKIHVYNVDDLVKHTLPYHETSLFVRIIQLSQIEKTRWHFFEGVKKSGATPSRRLLVQQCMKDRVILEAICELIPEYTADGRITEIPCVALSCLESKILTGFDQPYQDVLFERIIHLSRMNAEGLQRASHDCLLAIDVADVTIERFISGMGNKLSAYEQNIVENQMAVVDASNGLSAVLESLIAQRSYAKISVALNFQNCFQWSSRYWVLRFGLSAWTLGITMCWIVCASLCDYPQDDSLLLWNPILIFGFCIVSELLLRQAKSTRKQECVHSHNPS